MRPISPSIFIVTQPLGKLPTKANEAYLQVLFLGFGLDPGSLKEPPGLKGLYRSAYVHNGISLGKALKNIGTMLCLHL